MSKTYDITVYTKQFTIMYQNSVKKETTVGLHIQYAAGGIETVNGAIFNNQKCEERYSSIWKNYSGINHK